jgi:hypothetical protein
MKRLPVYPLFALLLVSLLAGCAGYKLGPTNGVEAGARSIQVNPFVNSTREARLGEPVTSALRKMLQQDGTYKLNSSGDADLIVEGEITDFIRTELTYQPSDVATVRDYDLTVVAKFTVRERSSGKIVIQRRVRGWTSILVGSDLASGERQALPMLAESLARSATSAIVDGTW